MTLDAKILVLHHERQPRDTEEHYLVSAMAKTWRDWGCEVRHQYGIREVADADVAILHLDLSVVPQAYVDYVACFPAAVNVAMSDIRKRVISKNLVRPGDSYEGAVIVKTDLNHGGTPEVRLGLAPAPELGLATRIKRRLGFKDPQRMVGPQDYRVYPSKDAVPQRVFEDPSLVVERFLGERDGESFVHRRYLFCGDVEVHQAWAGSRAVNFWDHAQDARDADAAPANLRALREEFGADYGKFDYALVDGQAQVFDVNRTPSGWVDDPVPADAAWARQVAASLAPGIKRWVG